MPLPHHTLMQPLDVSVLLGSVLAGNVTVLMVKSLHFIEGTSFLGPSH